MDCVTLVVHYPTNHVALVLHYHTFAVGINYYCFNLEWILIQPIFAALRIHLQVLHSVPLHLSIGKHLEESFSYFNIFRSDYYF